MPALFAPGANATVTADTKGPTTMSEPTDAPQGDLTLRTVAMPADMNGNGDIFGGWVLSHPEEEVDLGRELVTELRQCGMALAS